MTTDTTTADQTQLLSPHMAVLLTALGLGVAADYLFWSEGPDNLARAIWVILFCGAVTAFSWHQQKPWRMTVACLAAASAAASCLVLLRDSDILGLAMLGIFFASGLQILLRTAGVGFFDARLAHFFRAAFAFPLQAGFGVFPVLGRVDIGRNWGDPRIRGIVRGLLLALPLLALFIALFSSADEGFSRYVPDLATLFSPDTLPHLTLVAVFFMISGGLLAGVLKTRSLTTVEIPQGKLGAEETGIVLGLLAALFTAFVLFQLRYLFGGQETITSTTGLTVAEYARRGFFELLWVAILTLGLLLIVARMTKAPHLLRLFGSVMVACVLVMLASAAQRMLLYIDSFGLSIDRITASTIMLWIASCLVLCAFTVLANRDRGFASGMANLGITFCLLLILVNPGALVTEVNIERSLEHGQPLDVNYLLTRGADVVSPLLKHFDALPGATQCEVAVGLLRSWAPLTEEDFASSDWRMWNYSKQQARSAVALNLEKLRAKAALVPVDFAAQIPIDRANSSGRDAPILQSFCP